MYATTSRDGISTELTPQPRVIALHCSLSSGRQWAPLIEAIGPRCAAIAPDISGYGSAVHSLPVAATLADEVILLGSQLAQASGPLHLIGHSYGAAIAFEMATASPLALRVRTLTMIEPVLPTILLDHEQDLPLYARFLDLAAAVRAAVRRGDMRSAVKVSAEFWQDAGAPKAGMAQERAEQLARVVKKLDGDFNAVFAKRSVADHARRIKVPTLLLSGGLSPDVTRRIVLRLAKCIQGARVKRLPDAGHMLPITHATEVNAWILDHLRGRLAGNSEQGDYGYG
jgi:pimeloyl-ACP methyl ester carboxylesterase